MFDKPASDRVPEALFRADNLAHGKYESHASATAWRPRDVTIAISREVGTSGTTIASELGKRLGWDVYDHELVERIAREMNLRVWLLDRIDEQHRTWVQQCVDAFFMVRSVPEMAYVRRLVETLMSLASQGRCIVVGRGAAHLLPSESTLRVRLVAPLNHRISAVMLERQLGHEEAHKYVLETENTRSRFVKDHFLVDPADPHNYDLVINSARCPAGECVDLIVDALNSMRSPYTVAPVMSDAPVSSPAAFAMSR